MPINTMQHMEFNRKEFRFSLTGNCITVFCNGQSIYHRFYESSEIARVAFLQIA